MFATELDAHMRVPYFAVLGSQTPAWGSTGTLWTSRRMCEMHVGRI